MAEHQDAVAFVDERAFLGDQVEAVPDGVDQQDIGAPNSLVANAVARREARQLDWINVDLP